MINFLLILLAAECAALIAWGFYKGDHLYRFPFWAAWMFTSFCLFQLYGLRNDASLPNGGLEQTILMTILCLVMCFLGDKSCSAPAKLFQWKFSDNKLLIVGAVFTIAGGFCFYQISRLPEDLTQVSQWTGLPVIYIFFGRLLSYGFTISLILLVRSPSFASLVLSIVGALFYLDQIVIGARRGIAAEFIFIVLCVFWFSRKKAIPRVVMVAVLFAGTLALYSIGEYRAIVTQGGYSTALAGGVKRDWNQVSKIPYLQDFDSSLNEGGTEMRNAVYGIAGTAKTLKFDFGLFNWNRFVFNFVPAQLVGTRIKESLMFQQNDALAEFGYTAPIGSTLTGMSDSFGSFWYFGCLKFFVIAFILRKIYLTASSGNFLAQVSYPVLLMPGVESVTHSTQNFFNAAIHIGIFLLPTLIFVRQSASGHILAGTASKKRRRRIAEIKSKTTRRLT